MRISDWSSDVCSSDLQLRLSFQAENRSRQLHRKPPFRAVSATPPYAFARTECVGLSKLPRMSNASPIGGRRLGTSLPGDPTIAEYRRQASDRKSVVKEQSVAVRVELGGRSIFHK